MGRILALDYGLKRIGIAVSDPLQIIAQQLITLSPSEIWQFLDGYFSKEEVELVLIGYPVQTNGKGGSDALRFINPFIERFLKRYPHIPLRQVDERFTSKIAQRLLIEGGFSKSQQQDKGRIDRMSAAIMLQEYLNAKKC
ncbi:MAG TPA: Holliday junction resolvase RuvX [Bacteroidales bacterium]|nr:Holliday junction resolvase RuvX [Bacteroidales bacterium]HPO64851.1 Holliday junction resolvase RuvX [Bacteroidales bacterium]